MKKSKIDDKNKPIRQRKPINGTRLLLIIVFIIYFILQVYIAVDSSTPIQGNITYNELITKLDNEEVEKVEVTKQSDKCTVIMKDGTVYETLNPQSDTYVEDLLKHNAPIAYRKSKPIDSIVTLLGTLPLVIIVGIFAVYLANTIIGGSTKMFTLLKAKENTVTFDSIKGLKEAKTEVKFAVEQLKQWDKLSKIGARPCKGILLYGPSGTGKTLLAKAIAAEAGVPFISACGSDFNEVFVGVGAARVRSLWTLAAQNAPCIIFIDEIDCLGKRRKGGDGASKDGNQTINSLLQRMDGLNKTNGVMVVAATNRKDDLDPALLRPGRFDKQYYIGPPNGKEERDEMVEYYLQDKLLKEGEVDVESASKLMVGLTGAEIEESLNEAVYISLREGRNGVIKLSDIDEAVMKLRLSGVKQEHTSERDEQITAIHEAGHTVVSLALNIPIAKVSIISYSGGTGGVTMKDLDKAFDIKLKLRSELENDIKVLLAGMLAEDLKYGEHTQGCSADLEEATKEIYKMITSYGHGKNILNENVLMEAGINHLLEGEIIQECNEKLAQFIDITKKILQDNFEYVTNLSDMLLRDKTIVQPTLEKIKQKSNAVDFERHIEEPTETKEEKEKK